MEMQLSFFEFLYGLGFLSYEIGQRNRQIFCRHQSSFGPIHSFCSILLAWEIESKRRFVTLDSMLFFLKWAGSERRVNTPCQANRPRWHWNNKQLLLRECPVTIPNASISQVLSHWPRRPTHWPGLAERA
jgi:hypothetical protein